MKLFRLISASLLCLAGLWFVPPALALRAPQDNWRTYSSSAWSFPGFPRAITVAPNDEVYVAIEDVPSGASSGPASISVFNRSGALVRSFASPPITSRVVGMAIGKNGTVFVFSTDRQVRAYSANGTLSAQWGGTGTGSGLFGNISITALPPTYLAVDSAENVYVADMGNRLIQKFSSNGTFLTQWGGTGTLAGQFGSSGVLGVTVTPQDRVVVASTVTARVLQMFDVNGTLIPLPSVSGTLSSGGGQLAALPDELIILARSSANIGYYDNNLASIFTITGALSASRVGIAANRHGDFYVMSYTSSGGYTGTITRYERGYSVDNPPAGNTPPQPALLSTEQRPSTPFVDIDYKIIDPDDATVRVALLGFVDGGTDLGKVLKLSSFAEGTAANVGLGQPTNTVRRVTWNAAADWSVEFGNVQIEVLAQDSRGLLPVHWITLPALGAEPAVTISRRAVMDSEFMNLWYWLIATSDSGIALNNGQITAVGGAFAGQILADTSGSTSYTTPEGRAYLLARCGMRAITAAEITRASGGQFGFTEVNESSVVRVINPAP